MAEQIILKSKKVRFDTPSGGLVISLKRKLHSVVCENYCINVLAKVNVVTRTADIRMFNAVDNAINTYEY